MTGDLFKRLYAALSPEPNPALSPAFQAWQTQLPTLWLLGKTGAGKSSLIRALTGDSAVEIGNGFRPCTRTAAGYDFPATRPVLRFLDTRGLGEAGYDPAEDIRACQGRSHALLALVRADDPEQGALLKALADIRRQGGIGQLLAVHTGLGLVGDPRQRGQAVARHQQLLEQAWGQPLTRVELDLPAQGEAHGLEALLAQLAEVLPIARQMLEHRQHRDREQHNFALLRRELLWYAGAAGACDALPAVGLVAVPGIQGKLLHSLAAHYGLEWDRRRFAEFAAALGGGFALHYLSRLGARQLIKFIPVYGQTLGATTAAAMSFATTYALGRAACKYLYHLSRGEEIVAGDIRASFDQAMQDIRSTAEHETHRH